MLREYPAQQLYGTFVLHAHTLQHAVYTSFSSSRLARGSILASVIRIMPSGLLRVGALYVSGLFMILYIMIIVEFVWVCQTSLEPDGTGYVLFFGSTPELYPPHVVMNDSHPVFHIA
jgi:hypothetical protein